MHSESGAVRRMSRPSAFGASNSLLLLGAAVVLLFALQAVSRADTASADVCVPNEGNFLCSWEANIAPGNARYFSAAGGNNLRNWIKAGVGDQYGGAVAEKCVYMQRGSDGAAYGVACGSGFPSNTVANEFKPGYLYIIHWANGARIITGAGVSP